MKALTNKNTSTPGIVVGGIPVPGVYLGGHTEVSGTGIEFVPNTPVWFGM